MHQLELELALKTPGVYFLADTRFPHVTIPVSVMDGKLFSMRHENELDVAMDKWTETAHLVGGPYTTQICLEMQREREESELRVEALETELAFWRGMVTRMEPAMILLRDTMLACNRADVAMQTQDILNELVPMAHEAI